MATSKKVVTREEWEGKLRDVKIRKEDMNRLVMNFLVTEGFVDAADRFRVESGTQPEIDLATITDRMEVKKAVQSGNVQEAIEKINDLNPTILDTNPEIYFHLQQQKLIELIRVGKIHEALEFAQEELAPRGEENLAFLEEIEKTVALLVFEDVKNCPYGELLDVSQRLKTASEVNAAILTSQSHEKAEIDLAAITDRMEVKKAVQSGNIQEAIEKINDLNPTILDTNPEIYFHLQQQKLIELIRVGKVHEALEFAQEELAPRGEENLAFLEEIEKTVALLVFEDVKNCPYGELLDVSQRLKTASEVNAAILTSQSHEKDPKLPSLLKMLTWTQNQLSEKAAYPRINNLSTADLEDPAI